ncbi:MAG: calcium-binding protein, partial [Bradyrhizobium sp.]|nr:calcium-binding protein [Bradyrhizobium sp.]
AGAITTITDLSAGADTIALSRAIFTKVGPVGPMAAGAFFIGAAAHDASDRIIYNSTTGALSYDSDGTGAQAARHFATLGRGLALSANDFAVV